MSLSRPKAPFLNSLTKSLGSGLVLNVDENSTRLNQIHGINPNNATGSGIPKQVSNVAVSVANAQAGSTCTVSVLFRRDPTDTSFSGVNIWVRGYQGNSQLVQVASGSSSPCKFVLNNTGETVSFTIQAYGNGGNAPLNQSPTAAATLPKSAIGGFGSSSVIAYTINNPPPTTGFGLPVDWKFVEARGDGNPVGFPNGVGLNGTGSQFNATATEIGGRKFTSSAVASGQNQIAVYGEVGANPGQGFLSLGTLARHTVRVLPQVSSTARYLIGILDNPSGGITGAAYSSDTPNTQYVGFRYSTGTDTTWKAVAGTSSAHQTVVDTGIPINTNASSLFEMSFSNGGTTVTFFINGLRVAVITTNLPSASYNIGNGVLVDNKNTATAQALVFFWWMTILNR